MNWLCRRDRADSKVCEQSLILRHVLENTNWATVTNLNSVPSAKPKLSRHPLGLDLRIDVQLPWEENPDACPGAPRANGLAPAFPAIASPSVLMEHSPRCYHESAYPTRTKKWIFV